MSVTVRNKLVAKTVIMDAYVKVGNDLQLAVKYIILSKKAFLKQSRCVKELTKQNDLLQQKVEELEMNNKELRALSLLTKQNQTLKKQVLDLTMSEHKKREHVLDQILGYDDSTFVLSEGVTSQTDSITSSDVNSTEDEEDVVDCPLSPTKRKRIQNKDCETPKKKITQKNNSQTDSGDAVEGDTTGLQIVEPRRSTRVKKKNRS